MKKKKFLAIVLIAGSACLGTGYSWWTEGLQVNGVVSTGRFKVVPTEGFTSREKCKSGKITVPMEESQDFSGFSYTLDDLYPQKQYWFTARFENQGSIPAQVAKVEIKDKESSGISGKGDVFKHLKVTGKVKVIAQGTVKDNTGEYPPVKPEYECVIPDKDGNKDITMYDLDTYLNGKIKGWKLEQTESIIFEDCKVQLINVKYAAGHNEREGSTIKFNLNVAFKQHNQE